MVTSENEPDVEEVAQGFAALGSEARLQVVLTLVRAGTDGLTIGEIQSRTGMAASTLAHHLKFLASAGLIAQEKQGRAVINRPCFPRLETLAGYILNQCCADLSGEPGD
jgi:DNA-binding transcriptional ArsR family regulator